MLFMYGAILLLGGNGLGVVAPALWSGCCGGVFHCENLSMMLEPVITKVRSTFICKNDLLTHCALHLVLEESLLHQTETGASAAP